MPRLMIRVTDEEGNPMCAGVLLQAPGSGELVHRGYVDGAAELTLDAAEVDATVSCGKLYDPCRMRVARRESSDRIPVLDAVLRRAADPAKYGLYSFDAHNHVSRVQYDPDKTIGLEQAVLIAKGEGLNCLFAGVPYDYESHKEAKSAVLIGKAPYRKRYADLIRRVRSKSFILDLGNEYCKYRHGHVFMLNYVQTPPVNMYRDPVYTAYEVSRNIPATTEPPFSNVPISNAVAASKGPHSAAVYAHPTSWWYDKDTGGFVTNIASTLGFDILTGAVDAVVVMGYRADHVHYQRVWYELLNNGYFVPGVAETDACMDAPGFAMPPYRTYVYVSELSLDNIGDAVRGGRCMVSSGPILHFTVDGSLPGSLLPRIAGREYRVHIQADACCEAPLDRVQLILNGTVCRELDIKGKRNADVSIGLTVERDSYLLAKCYDAAGNLAMSNPVYLRNAPFLNVGYRSRVVVEVRLGASPATGTYRIGEKGPETPFDGKLRCLINPCEPITVRVGEEERRVELFWLEPLQAIFKSLYHGEFNADRRYRPGEVPPEAFRIGEIRSLLDSVTTTVRFCPHEQATEQRQPR